MIVTATDYSGKHWKIKVTLGTFHDRPTISFDDAAVYFIDDVLESFPFTTPLDIDTHGSNHGGPGTGPVLIDKETINKIVHKMILN